MREIKFKGIKNSDGKWIVGDLNHIDGKVFIFNRNDELNSTDDYEVDPETVGQYTGLKDKNGVEIYEGDNIKYQHISSRDLRKGIVKYNNKDARFGINLTSFHLIYNYNLEIIGNIHDK